MDAIRYAVVLVLGACAVACSESSATRANASEPSPQAPVVVATPAAVQAPPKDDPQPADFDGARDPFQPPAIAEAPPPPPPRDARKARRWSTEDLKLVALVTRTDAPRAMLVDPRGKGWVVARGDLVGRPELVRGSYMASWRVDRIREDGVTLVRDDVGATRVIAMRIAPPVVDEEQND